MTACLLIRDDFKCVTHGTQGTEGTQSLVVRQSLWVSEHKYWFIDSCFPLPMITLIFRHPRERVPVEISGVQTPRSRPCVWSWEGGSWCRVQCVRVAPARERGRWVAAARKLEEGSIRDIKTDVTLAPGPVRPERLTLKQEQWPPVNTVWDVLEMVNY